MKTTTGFVFLAGLACTLGAPSACMLSPLISIKAGDKLVTGIENTLSGPCELILLFSDDDFLPVTFAFEPIACSAFQKAEISIPLEVPIGPATLLWQCVGQQATGCIRASLEGGSGNFDLLNIQQSGTVTCLMPTATYTSLLTITQQSTTMVSSIITTEFATEMDTTSSTSSSTLLSSQNSRINSQGSGHTSAAGITTWPHATISASDISSSSTSSITLKSSSTITDGAYFSNNEPSSSFSTKSESSSTATEGADSSDDKSSSSSSTRSGSSSFTTNKVDSSNINTFSSSSVTSTIPSITIVMEQTAPRAPACTMDH
ncbi:hypothetical protein sscle_05g041010 [Sclerotinia sclerotiorum 1980 UF-70]|uniref:Uncharacterized protein n=1 Tax=Sclerotinia sclerotiorum (strain ATCC 18683 / 1980 / Ss-1) TaxID=665079 RepID=A0A1D9Q307_SCLS1|nr:hypothetical protein sscle_05g041010 [Sclerotinia sclerotiorum 1980 UF-70]